jgi:hypothetical protein
MSDWERIEPTLVPVDNQPRSLAQSKVRERCLIVFMSDRSLKERHRVVLVEVGLLHRIEAQSDAHRPHPTTDLGSEAVEPGTIKHETMCGEHVEARLRGCL